MTFLPSELIRKKRFGGTHSDEELKFLVDGFAAGELPDYQMAAWLMAVCFRGMTASETAAFTTAMMNSGRVLSFSSLNRVAVDKHSTGGVGDKTSLILAPLVGAAGVPVPMMAGRGLGHTGGTLDKLESIPGFSVHLSLERFTQLVSDTGAAIIGQTKDICPADLKLYALRDVTGTVDSIPLICASIMSKKLAEGCGALVLDVKFGTGAFMKTLEQATQLAQGLVSLGSLRGVRTVALLTSMNRPLGRFIGNALEIRECLEIMDGSYRTTRRPELYQDTLDLTLALAAQMLRLGNAAVDESAARRLAEETLASGAALRKFHDMCRAQGAKLDWRLPEPRWREEFLSPASGYFSYANVEELGLAAIELGAGRRKAADQIDHSAGFELLVKPGEKVTAGQPLVRLFADSSTGFTAAKERLKSAVRIEAIAQPVENLIAAVVTDRGVHHVHGS